MHDNFKKGYIQVYTGNGKGKTTAAIGVTMRALASGMAVFFGQFMKNTPSSEHLIYKDYPAITHRLFGTGKFVIGKPDEVDYQKAAAGWAECKEALLSGDYDLVVMDELCVTLLMGLLDLNEVLETIKQKPEQVELIITGRGAPQELIDAAQLVTEMKEIKHYYSIGVPARRGIEE